MNILLWVLQVLLALHTAMGAVWKFSNTSEQTSPSLKAIPNGVWTSMIIVELLCSTALILPVFSESLSILAPIAAVIIAAEMLIFCGLHLYSGSPKHNQMVYWLAVAAICVFIAYGRFALTPF